jgi:CRP/FNR family cyclic AMP-dependent transcriptional regulator
MAVPFQYLQNFPLLKPLPQEALLRLSTQVEERQFARREVVCGKDQTRSALGFLLEGRLQGVDFTVDGRAVGLYFVEAGDYFGELSVVDGLPPSEHILAATRSTALFLDAAAARQLIFGTPELAQAVMTRLSARVRAVTAQRTLLALPNPFQRLCVQLLLLGRRTRTGETVIDPVPTHQELAIMINSSRETVTRAFQVLILHQTVLRDGNQLKILQPDYLVGIKDARIDPPKT